jgi:hypothetical protein
VSSGEGHDGTIITRANVKLLRGRWQLSQQTMDKLVFADFDHGLHGMGGSGSNPARMANWMATVAELKKK